MLLLFVVVAVVVTDMFMMLMEAPAVLSNPLTSTRIIVHGRKVRDWLKTKQGMGRVMDEVKKRKAVQSLRISVIDATVGTLKVRT